MKCLIKGTPYTGTYDGGYPSKGATVCQASLPEKNMLFSGTIKANAVATNTTTSGNRVYTLGGGIIEMNVGTIKPHPISIVKYTSLKIKASNTINECVRIGSRNASTTNTSSATVLLSGSGNLSLALANSNPYFVVGYKKEYKAGYGTEDKYYNGLNYSYSCNVTEIYLV